MVFYNRHWRSYFWSMKMLIRVLAVVSISGLLALTTRADAVATLSGVVRDAKGAPLHGAEIRIVGSDASKVGRVHTDASGRYNYAGLETGTYNVTLIVGGITKASINNVRTKSGEVQTLNFDLQGNAAARPFANNKHYVWVPLQTGSHLGTWAEVENDGKAMPSGMSERVNNQGNAFIRKLELTGSQGETGH
jgi:Carboxypeptidase regulatory-like domain